MFYIKNKKLLELLVLLVLLVLLGLLLFIIFKCTNIKSSLKDYTSDFIRYNEEDFQKLNPNERWRIRIKCLKNFNLYSDYYKPINYIKELPNYYKNNLIFVSIASYRDPECPLTIKNLIQNASNKSNLRIIVCQQNDKNDIDALKGNELYKNLIKIIRLDYLEAKGPTYARHLIQQTYNSEEFYLQIDSHTLFEKDWDTKLIDSINDLPEKSCITQYLPEYNRNTKKIKSFSVRDGLKVVDISNLDGFSRVTSKFVNPSNLQNQLYIANGWSGCFSFSRGNICQDAPIDPYTPELFFGEEMDIAIRLYTRGWNFYSPNYPIAYTNFTRSYRKTFWNKRNYNKNITLISRIRIHYRLNTLPIKYKKLIEEKYPELLIDEKYFTLGNVRTLAEYENLIGLDIIPDD